MTPAAIQLTRQLARAESELAGWERRAERNRTQGCRSISKPPGINEAVSTIKAIERST